MLHRVVYEDRLSGVRKEEILNDMHLMAFQLQCLDQKSESKIVSIETVKMPTKREIALDAMEKFATAADNLVNAWYALDKESDELMATDYPFQQSFDELASAIDNWIGSVRYEFDIEEEE